MHSGEPVASNTVASELIISDLDENADSEVMLDVLAEWVTGSREAAHEYLSDHRTGGGSTLIARIGESIAGLITIRWTSNNPDFAARNVPLIQQLLVLPRFRRMGVASVLLDAAEQLAAQRGRTTIGVTVGVFDQYGPAQRLYAQRGYLPDGRGACRARDPLTEGQQITVDHSLIIWLTKDLRAIHTPRPAEDTPSAPARLLVRHRRERDLETIVNLAFESLSWHAETFPDVRPAPSTESLASAYQQLEDSTKSYFRVAEIDGEVVGFLSASIQPPTTSGIEALDDPSVYIGDIVVTASVRRRGIARALLTDLDGWATDHGCHVIRLNMHAGNAPAQHLYERLGFHPTWITFRKSDV
jgi:GNAT superfamily N-acetyltransferase